jgi:hypothetical protein
MLASKVLKRDSKIIIFLSLLDLSLTHDVKVKLLILLIVNILQLQSKQDSLRSRKYFFAFIYSLLYNIFIQKPNYLI